MIFYIDFDKLYDLQAEILLFCSVHREIALLFWHMVRLSRLIVGSCPSHHAFGPPSRDTTLSCSHDCHLFPALSIRCSISPLCPTGVTTTPSEIGIALPTPTPKVHAAAPCSPSQFCLHNLTENNKHILVAATYTCSKYLDNRGLQRCFLESRPLYFKMENKTNKNVKNEGKTMSWKKGFCKGLLFFF